MKVPRSLLCLVVASSCGLAASEPSLSELNCTACHAASDKQAAWLPPNPAPRLADVGGRASGAWMKRFLAAPRDAKPGARMPDVLRGNADHAEALTHFLLSQSKTDARSVFPDKAAVARGESLYHSVGCVACHAPQNGAAVPADSIPLPRMAEKWAHDGLRRFLLDPLASRPGGRMPAMSLADGEASDIAHYLLRETKVPAAEPPVFIVDAAKAQQGRVLYASLNCAACHESKPLAQPPPALAALDATRGCLAEKPAPNVPDFNFDAAQRDAVRKALAALNGPAPTSQQRVAHTMSAFRCTACHARDGIGGVTPERAAFFTANVDDLGDEGRLPPKLDGVGDKLRPEWLAKVLGDGASVRPYLNTRMPKFGAGNVGHLAGLFVALDRRATPAAAVNDAPNTLRDAGRRLTGTDGLSCIACHRFARQPAHAMQVLDLTTTTERLNEDWFRRFLRDPNRFNTGTRMPALWPGGTSLVAAVLDGDTDRQHAALWTYFADGAKAKFPEGLSRQSMELIVGGEAVVYRGKLWEAGFRGIAAGYPGGVNASFDAEEMRLAVVWRGRFLNVSPHWSVQGMGKIRPLGTDEIVLPHGTPFAVLADANAPWPAQTSRELGMKFRGCQLDAQKRPTFLYSSGAMDVEDFIAPIATNGKSGLHRTLKFSAAAPDGMHFRIATGKLAADGEHAWRLNDALTIAVKRAFARGKGEQQELLVPLRFADGSHQLDLDYAWPLPSRP